MWNIYTNKKEFIYNFWLSYKLSQKYNFFIRKNNKLFWASKDKKIISKNTFLNFSEKKFNYFWEKWKIDFKSERKKKIFYKFFGKEISFLEQKIENYFWEKWEIAYIYNIWNFFYYLFFDFRDFFDIYIKKSFDYLNFYFENEDFILEEIPWYGKIFFEIYDIPENIFLMEYEFEKYKNKNKIFEKKKILNPQTYNHSKKWWKNFLNKNDRNNFKKSLKNAIKNWNLEDFSTTKMKNNKRFFD